MNEQTIRSNLNNFGKLNAEERLTTIREAITRNIYNNLESQKILVIEKAISSEIYNKLNSGEKLDVLEEAIKPEIYDKLSAKQQASAIEKVTQVLSDVYGFLGAEKLPFYAKITLFIGMTGAGKSLLINYLAGKKIEVVMKNGELVLNILDPLTGISISHSITSHTTFPKARVSGEDVHIDTPGLGDSRGILHRIVNTLLTQEVISNSQSVKFVLSLEEGYLMEKGLYRLKSSLDGLKIYAKDFSKFKEGISVVITKGTTKQGNVESVTWAIDKIKHILSEEYDLSEYQREVLKFISEGGKIQYTFKAPIRETSEIGAEESAHIKAAIKELKHVDKPESIHMELLDDDRVKIMKVIEQVSKNIKELIEDFGVTVRNYFSEQMSQIKENSDRQQPHKLKADLLSLSDVIKSFYDLDNRAFNVKDFANKSKAQIEKIKTLEAKELDAILRQANLLYLFADLAPNTSNDIFSDGLVCLKQLFDSLHTNISLTGDELIVTGGFPLFSEVMEKVKDKATPHLKTIKINGDDTVLLDEDLKGYELSGVNVLVAAQKCLSVGNTNIVLDGIPGADQQNRAPDGILSEGGNGSDGKSGKPGGPGGNFVAVCGETSNIGSLSLSINGGNGGKGQPGGNGADSKDIIQYSFGLGNCGQERSEDSFCMKRRYKDCALTIPGKKGGNGGRGGHGAKGGFPGTAKITNLFEHNKVEIALKTQSIRGEEGEDGGGGSGGKGGHGISVTGNWVWKKHCFDGVVANEMREERSKQTERASNGISPTEKNAIGLIEPVENFNPFEATLQSTIDNAKTSFDTYNKALAQCKVTYHKPIGTPKPDMEEGWRNKCKNVDYNFDRFKDKVDVSLFGKFSSSQLKFTVIEQTADGLPISAVIDISNNQEDYIVCIPGFDVDEFVSGNYPDPHSRTYSSLITGTTDNNNSHNEF